MTIRGLRSAACIALMLVGVSSCGDQAGPAAEATATQPAAPPAPPKPSLPPVVNDAGATFVAVADLSPIVEGARVLAVEGGGYTISPSSKASGYQVGTTLPSDEVDFVVLRYQLKNPAEAGSIGILAEDGSRWLASSELSAPNGKLTTAVTDKSVRFVLETQNGAKPVAIEKLEWATFCVKPSTNPDVAPVAEQCYPKLQPIFAIESARFTAAPPLAPWTTEANVATGPNGAVTVTPSSASSGYQASVEIAKGNAAAFVVRYELESAGAVGNIGILRGDAAAWVATASFGPGMPTSGQITTGLIDGAGVKLVVESAAGAPAIKFRKLELASLCETKPAQGLVAATVSGCP